MLVIWAIALGMRLWHLGAIEPPVFDEVYFPVFAESYLDGVAPFDVHPPLGKYEIALGILLFGRNAIGYRIASAIAGSLIPIALAGLVYRLTQRWRLALTVGLLMLLEGLFLVESRFGLMNVWLVLFGVTAHIYAVAALQRQGWQRFCLLGGCGLLLGASSAVKWNGLGYALGLGGMALLALGARVIPTIAKGLKSPSSARKAGHPLGIWAQLGYLRWWHYLLCLGVVPVAVYGLQWLPHLWLLENDPPLSIASFPNQLMQIHQQMLGGHASATSLTGDTPVHPYCSSWWTWPLLGRPIAYFFAEDGEVWRDIHAIGNPLQWWASTITIASFCFQKFYPLLRSRDSAIKSAKEPQNAIDGSFKLYLLVGYAANLLPWMVVSRCTFLYHYMGALAFSTMALAWGMERMLFHPDRVYRWWGWNLAIAILACGLFFWPLWFGLPLSPTGFYRRMWFRGDWIVQMSWI
ncbi:MAG: phospholipid carrier-dependent glycosyltransferase [Synechococcus sp.]